MHRFLGYQLALLASTQLLILTSCTAQSEVQSVAQPAQTLVPKTVAAQPAATVGKLLSPEQVAKLKKLPIPVVAPTYLPVGFRVVQAEGESAKYANGDDDSGYTLEYQRDDNTCFAIRSSQDGPRGLTQVGQVETAIGKVSIYQEYQGQSSLQSFIPVKGNPVMISPVSRLNSATGNYEVCKPLRRVEYERILQSIAVLK